MNDTKERMFRLRLSDTDCGKLSSLSARAGITPEKLLERFIGDLLSDNEKTFAPQWFQNSPLFHLWYDPLALTDSLDVKLPDDTVRQWEREMNDG